MQGAIRSAVATLLVLVWARWRGIALWQRDGTLAPGLARRPRVRRRVRADLRGARAHDRGADGRVPLPRPVPHRARPVAGSCPANACAPVQWARRRAGVRGHARGVRRRLRRSGPRDLARRRDRRAGGRAAGRRRRC